MVVVSFVRFLQACVSAMSHLPVSVLDCFGPALDLMTMPSQRQPYSLAWNAIGNSCSINRLPVCRESDEEEVSGSDAGEELATDEIEASDDSDVIDVEAPPRKRKAPQTSLKVRMRSVSQTLCVLWEHW